MYIHNSNIHHQMIILGTIIEERYLLPFHLIQSIKYSTYKMLKIIKFEDNKEYSFIFTTQDSSSDDDITRAISSAVSSQLKY